MSEKYDDTLLHILQEEKNVVKFFDTIFGFLKRRTDFYVISKSPQDSVGLLEGFAEKIVYDALMKYKSLDENLEPIIENFDVQREECVTTCNASELDSNSQPEPLAKLNQETCKEIKHKPDNYNGASYDNYSWSQSITDLDVQITLSSTYTPKQLDVNILTNFLSIKLKNENICILEGTLHRKIKAAETIWSVDKNILQIHIEKQMESWWERFLTTEPVLDLQQMDCSRPLEDLPEDVQAKIEQLRWDAEQRNKGLPTSQDNKKTQLLEKAWNADGSPFKGTPFNPSIVSFEEQ
ncbi:nudC domain-containing protein 3 [Chrysoperla carnea]|uniref:nudC domain-containing protein 3 n=1 Tax=Chrysoperla carnea TaxID=189513 RepID=UPI001D0909CC|nr:nudC domain-containing protein 3 [Chrysoperla carnea]